MIATLRTKYLRQQHQEPAARRFSTEGEALQLTSLRLRNYRTVGAAEQYLPLASSLTIVGPNNSGKTNLLRSIQLFFTGHENKYGYDTATDLPFGRKPGSIKTSMVATFDGDDKDPDGPDAQIYAQLDQLNSLYGRARHESGFSLSLVFGPSGTPTYQFFPNLRKPKELAIQGQISRIQRKLVWDILSKFECHYVPSAKSITELYHEVFVPFLRAVVARAIAPQVDKIHEELRLVAESINDELKTAGLGDLTAAFDFPEGSPERLLSSFDFNLSDPHKTPLSRKGQGIQSTALTAGFLWVAGEERAAGKSTIWLLEEPESYLHPQLTGAARSLLDSLSQQALVVATTHSLAFVPRDPITVIGTRLQENATHVERFDSYSEATSTLRKALGVRFADYFNMAEYNLLVEGKTDRQSIGWFLDLTSADSELSRWPRVRQAALMDFGGVGFIGGFLRSTYSMIRDERATVTIFDGDPAGDKERRGLTQYFGQKSIPFQANQDYLIVRDRFSIEGLFPDQWIIELAEEHPSWFEDYSVDVSGTLMPFRVKDSSKSSLLGALYRKAEQEPNLDWAARWVDLMNAAEAALEKQERRLADGDSALYQTNDVVGGNSAPSDRSTSARVADSRSERGPNVTDQLPLQK